MVGDPHQRHDAENRRQRAYMEWHYKHKRGDDNRPRQSFPRMKRHGGPGGGRATGMVYRVRNTEQPRLVHPTVRPIEPRIVQKETEQHRHRPPPEWIGMNVAID